MKLDVTQQLSGYDGTPMYDDEKQPLTMRSIILTALNSFTQGEHPTGEEKAKIYSLSVKISTNDQAELSLDDRTLIKKRAEMILRPITLGPVIAAIEDTPTKD
jgi:hypothetical protein